MEMRIPTWGNSSARAMMRSVKKPLVEMTMRSDFLYSSRTISARSVLMKGSPPVMLVKYMRGSFLITSRESSSSGRLGAL